MIGKHLKSILVGKTIKDVIEGEDKFGEYFKLVFTDGTSVLIASGNDPAVGPSFIFNQ